LNSAGKSGVIVGLGLLHEKSRVKRRHDDVSSAS
jgi:hypothetical protein